MAYLLSVEGAEAGRAIALRSHRTTFGRSSDCDVIFTDRKSSRLHAQIVLTEGLITLIDLGSSNGTSVNGLPVSKTFLNAGDRIEMGDNAFVFYEGEPETDAAAGTSPPCDLATIAQTSLTDELATELSALDDRKAIFSALESTYIQLRTLLTLSHELPRTAGPSAAFALLAKSLHMATGATRVLLWLRERNTLPALPTFVEMPTELAETQSVESFPRTIVEWVEQNRRPLMLTPGVSPLTGESLPQYPLMVLPVESGSHRLGVIAIERIGSTERFLKRDLDFATAACGYLALVLAETLERAPTRRASEAAQLGNIIIGQSQAMRDLVAETIRVAEANSSVLIRGESGTGKELIARTIHQLSRRSRGPFVAVNCGAITPTLIESELFGYEKGAFTGAYARKAGQFEAADGGTIFLDEVSELPADAQVKFLRVLQEGEFYRVGGNRPVRVDVRVVAATNRDLEKMIREGKFREDLYFRLNVVELEIPPLRSRREDIAPLVEYFFRDLRRQIPTTLETISAEAMEALVQHDLPGNVRQLQNAIEHALVMGTGKVLLPDHLPRYIAFPEPEGPPTVGTNQTALPTDATAMALADVERRHIESVLHACGGNKQHAATILGISRSTLYEKIRLYGLE